MSNTFINGCSWDGKEGPMDIKARLMKVKQSHFIQCLELIHAENGWELCEKERDTWKENFAIYLKACPAGSFEDCMVAMATHMLKNGEIEDSEKKYAIGYIKKVRSSKRGF